MVVAAGRMTLQVIPPSSGNLWMNADGSAKDIQIGDDVRVSLVRPGLPYAASLINIYRRDRGEQSAVSSDGAKKANEKTKERKTGSRQKRAKKASDRKTRSPDIKSSKRTKSRAEAQFKLGLNLLAKGNRKAAVKYFERARQADPSEAMAKRIAGALAGKLRKSSQDKGKK